MGKVCTTCGAGPAIPTKPVEEPEDCVDCGGKDTVKGAPEEKSEGSEEESEA